MKTSDNGIKFIERHEGLRLTAYQDVTGKWTIGYGHLIQLPYEEYFKDVPISESIAENLLKIDVRKAEVCVLKNCTMPLDQCQFDSLVSFVYNLGCNALERSTLLFLLNQGRYSQAAAQFLKWNKAGGKEVKGLTLRRNNEMKLFVEGQYV